jgi:hypothetical protein
VDGQQAGRLVAVIAGQGAYCLARDACPHPRNAYFLMRSPAQTEGVVWVSASPPLLRRPARDYPPSPLLVVHVQSILLVVKCLKVTRIHSMILLSAPKSFSFGCILVELI